MSAVMCVLVATDDSEPARRAAQHVVDLAARGMSLDVHVLNVQPAVRGVAASLVSHSDLEGYHRDEGMKVLAGTLRLLEAGGVKPHAHVSVGDPAETIIAFAQRLKCDHIVIGSRGRGSVAGLLLGSVARQVGGGATVPVTLVR
ncbi:MAG: universal stress protein [Mycobacteriaceae bacterium]|nr:universal stress protein [Mycobacteriaceae bacterium]